MTVVRTLGAGAGVGRMLVDGNKGGSLHFVEDILGAIAMVYVEIKNCNFLGSCGARR